MVFSKPEKQGIFVLTTALAHLLAGLGLLYSWIRHEYSGVTWVIATLACLALVLSALVFWGRSKAKGIL
jgi:high-affinity Fe2+/Pb2+ permease